MTTPATSLPPLPWRPAILGLIALLPIPAAGHDDDEHGHDHPPAPVAEAEAHRPTAIPDRIILTFAGDPRTSQAVTWRTDTTVHHAFAEIALADHGPKFVDRAETVEAESSTLTTDLGEATFHSVVFEGLEPETTYAYRVGDGVNWSEWAHFTTASDEEKPFSFIYFGDAQNDLKSLWSRVIRGAYSDAPKARFIVHAGDLVNRSERDAEWGEWFSGGGWVNAMVPSIPTPGNHEYGRSEDGQRRLSRHWRPTFTLPGHGPEGLEETVYFIDYQGVRIISLNSNEKQREQASWLEGVLADNPNRWTIVTFHHPIYSAGKGRDNPALRDLWQPIFDQYAVDLVLQGHDHSYGRSGLIVGDQNEPTGAVVRNNAGTVYVVSVSGPKMYDLTENQEWMRRKAEDTQLYQIIRVDGDRLSFEARTAIGALYDAFDLVKREGKPNELIEGTPELGERLRRLQAAAEAAGD
ncbi:purple acid phosphatase family protein [Tautonia sociabilis]|uniref:Metallophosphoesterase family protein n=1 Tax=Tautonia sociabilis TaxID=2080755 RepID=A0A432MNA2_9BACT|nr:metallophosphoesterase family protein [Tautonia sociabilis]RUL88780.1 metallophosphoesterase family protein [Tautonia sociabilis]